MIRTTRRATATLAAGALIAGGLSVATFAPTAAAAPGVCTAANPTETITVFGFNDFHGRVIDDGRKVDDLSRYLAGALFTPVEQARVAQGDDHVLLLSSGDNIGASTFVSMIEDDTPTIDILNAAGVDASAVGNHEFDKGWTDLSGRVVPGSSFANLGANVYLKGTTTVAAPLKEYEIVTKAGLDIAIVGAVTGDVPSLVSPGGITGLDFGDPVAAINRVTDKLLDGDPTNGEADIVLASIHEGAGNGALSAADNAAASGAFDDIYRRIDDRVSVIFNGHTHQQYSYASANGGRPILQAKSSAEWLAKVDLVVDTVDGGVCTTTPTIIKPGVADESLPAIKEINDIARAAYTSALEKGERVIGTATQAISTAGDGGSGTRNQESPMTNTVAQMFADVLGGGDPEVIGVQNAGGTRDSFNAGDITYREAAMTLPFANSLFTVDLTGAQFTKVLEQQWQRDKEGNVPSRSYLTLGLSKNVSYTFDESLPEGSRITSVSINGKPIDPAKLYTIATASFLSTGGDNFYEFANGVNHKDTGRADIEAWVEWVEANSPLSPDYSRRGVSARVPAGTLKAGGPGLTFSFGDVIDESATPQTLDMMLNEGDKVSPKLANSTLAAFIGSTQVGAGTVAEGKGSITISLPAGSDILAGEHIVTFVAEGSGTRIYLPVTVVAGDSPTTPPVKPGLPSTGN